MLNFEEYKKQQYLNESSATTRYYRTHPDEIRNIGYTKKNKSNEYAIYIENIFKQRHKPYKKLTDELNILIKKHEKDLYKILPVKLYGWFDAGDFEDVDLNVDVPKEYKHLIPIIDKIKAAINYFNNYMSKIGMSRGRLSPKSVIDAISVISQWRETTISTVQKETLDVVKALTVYNIPKKLYRGIRFNYSKDDKGNILNYLGVKADKYYESFANKLEKNQIMKGDKIKYNFGNHTSWSTDMAVAEQFADFNHIKYENKYEIVISYEPKKEDIIADLRGIDLSDITGYHYQQELILDEGVYEFTIEKIVKRPFKTDLSDRIISKNKIYHRLSDIFIFDVVLKILSATKYKIIKDNESLEIANNVIKSNDSLYTWSKKYNYTDDYDQDDVTKLHPKIASFFVLYFNINENEEISFSIESIDLSTIQIHNSVVGDEDDFVSYSAIVKFKNYKTLFRKIEYDIIDIDVPDTNSIQIIKKDLTGILNEILNVGDLIDLDNHKISNNKEN